MFKKTFSLIIPAIAIIGSLHAAQDRKSFNAQEIEQMRNQSVIEICVKKPENRHCKQIQSVLNQLQNPNNPKFPVLKSKSLPIDLARAILYFQTQGLGKIMGWDEDRIKQETTLLHAALEKILAEPRQQQKK